MCDNIVSIVGRYQYVKSVWSQNIGTFSCAELCLNETWVEPGD